MSGIATAIVGGAIIGGIATSNAAGKAANAATQASDSANATQLQMYNQSRADQAPWRTVGNQALDALASQLGLAGSGAGQNQQPQWVQGADGQWTMSQPQQQAAPTAPDYSAFYKSPGYNFQMQQGTQAIDRGAAAKGLLGSGARLKALTSYGQGVAAQGYGDYLKRLGDVAGVGQNSASQTGQQAIQTGQIIGQNTMEAGAARASAYQNQGNSISNLLQQGAGLYGMYKGGYFSPSKPTGIWV